MPIFTITYRFLMAKDREETFSLDIDMASVELTRDPLEEAPFWTLLDYHQCANCPLTPERHSHCPLCLHLAPIVHRFEGIQSFDAVALQVEARESTVIQTTSVQRALGSMLGLVMAVSGRPHTVYFKPMARFHLPLATEEETIYRVSSMYLLAQYYLREAGNAAETGLEGLGNIYKNIHKVNMSIAERLRAAMTSDSSVNAVIMIDMYTKSVPYGINESLEEIRRLFQGYSGMV